MPNKNWMFHTAYAVLVIGAGLALFLSERPLSATVVSWALFSLNAAAMLFLVPAIMEFIREMKEYKNNNELLAELKAIKKNIETIAINLNEEIAVEKTFPSSATVTATTSAAPQSPSTRHSSRQVASASFDNIFAKPASIASSKSPAMQQTSLFVQTNEDVVKTKTSEDPVGLPSGATVTLAEETPAVSSVASTPTISESISQTPTEIQVATGSVSILANIHVEEDDVLCLRGEGAGLNWQEGIPMSYDGGDKWSWKALDIAQPITCRIYLNDEISAFGDDIELRPGQSIEVSPSFPKVEV